VDSQCRLAEPAGCALFRLFPQVALAIQQVKSNDIRRYIQAIRQNVCAVCRDQAGDGSRGMRQRVECALDGYLLLVVDAIEEANGRTFDKTMSWRRERRFHRARGAGNSIA